MRDRFWLIVVGVACVFAVAPAWAQADFLGLQKRIVEVADQYRLAMVRVSAGYQPEKDGDPPRVTVGSGFFVSREGLIMTNASIAHQPDRVWIEHQGVDYAADIIGADERSNLALLRVRILPKEFRFFHLVDAPDLPPVGSFVVRLSLPLMLPPTPRLGLVEGYEARFGSYFFPCLLMRTSIAGSPGDGGSAFVDLSGRLLGIQVNSVPDIDATYVLPSRALARIRDDLLFDGQVIYGWIGFQVREDASVEHGRRLVLDSVLDDTPARQAGLLPGDVLNSVGDYPVHSLDDLRNAMFYSRVGHLVNVVVERAGERREVAVEIVRRPEKEPLVVTEPPPSRDTPPVDNERTKEPSPLDAAPPLEVKPPLFPERPEGTPVPELPADSK